MVNQQLLKAQLKDHTYLTVCLLRETNHVESLCPTFLMCWSPPSCFMHDTLCEIVVPPPANLQDVSMSNNLGITIRYIFMFFVHFSGLKLNLM